MQSERASFLLSDRKAGRQKVNQESESEDRNCNVVPSSKDFTAFMRWFSGAFVVKAESYRWRPLPPKNPDLHLAERHDQSG